MPLQRYEHNLNRPSMEGSVEEEDQAEALQAEEERARKIAQDKQRLNHLGMSLSRLRSEAIRGRDATGIEQEWREDEQFYEGVDENTVGNHMSTFHSKPMGTPGPGGGGAVNSTVFVNITRAYTDAAAARVGDMLLPTDDRAWALDATPIPDMLSLAQGKIPAHIEKQIQSANPNDPEKADQVRQGVIDKALEIVNEGKRRAEKATKRIEDWHIESQYHAEMRIVIDDCAKLGSGVLKGPVNMKRKVVALVEGQLVVKEEIKPGSKRIDPWNFYPDPACGEDIHKGAYTWERDDITSKQLLQLKGLPGYLDEEIDQVLLEGPFKAVKEVEDRQDVRGMIRRETQTLYEIWYYYGVVEREDLLAMGKDVPEGTRFNVQLTMVNNHVIKCAFNPLDTGEFPYDLMAWQRRVGMPWGAGIARQVRTPQRIVNGAMRMMMDNAGRAGGPQLVIKGGVVVPQDGIYTITPWKVWVAGTDEPNDHLDNAFRFVEIPMYQKELEAIVNLGLRLAEDVTGLPLIMQGQVSAKTPKTLGGMEMMNNNASSVLRRIARVYDDMITERHIRRYYTYLLQYGPEDDEKGDMNIDARGSSALFERYSQSQDMLELFQYVTNPLFGIDPKKWFEEILKSRRLDARRFKYDDEEWKKIVEQLQQAPQDPRIAVKDMEIKWLREKLGIEHQFQGEKMGLELQSDLQLREKDAQLKGEEMGMVFGQEQFMARLNAELELNAQQGKKDMSNEQIKAMLAKVVMTLKSQEKLAGMREQREDGGKPGKKTQSGKGPQVAAPAAEPPGRADAGEAFIE